MEVVAEGVETQAHVDALRGLGCEYGQGFFFHRPVEPERITALLADRVVQARHTAGSVPTASA
jgi:EAL domain-containing protein (putative c-di-GMP-specific phosphodiesterase class I)